MACESIHPPWHISIFFALQTGIQIDFGGVCIILFTQHAYHFEDTKYALMWNKQEIRQKKQNLSLHNYSPPKSQYFVEPPFAAITAASLLIYVSSHWDFFPIHQGKTAPAPSSWMGSAGVQQSLSHTTDFVGWGLGFD